ncbi:MAG: hypothetical protein KUG83_03365 [Gammaproteobacteria bacterium]|nr:hypothetical protein [Gammaproteobacteria bacterium]
MSWKKRSLFLLLLVSLSGCSDRAARQSVLDASLEIQLLKQDVLELQTATLGYGEVEFKLENLAYKFSKEGFNPVLNGRATVIAVERARLPSMARVELVYQVLTSGDDVLNRGTVSVSLENGQGEMNLQVIIPAMMTNEDDIVVHIEPHRWYPVYLASPTS